MGRHKENYHLGRKADGQWYPGHISYEWDYTDDTGRHKQQIDRRIILDTQLTFPEDSFEADYIFNGE